MGYAKIAGNLLDNGANINTQTNNGWTALMISVRHFKPDVAKLLVKRGADISTTCNKFPSYLNDMIGAISCPSCHPSKGSYDLLTAQGCSEAQILEDSNKYIPVCNYNGETQCLSS